MSAVIIAFPAGLPARALIQSRLTDARRNPGLAASAERRAYILGFIDAGLKAALAQKPAPRRRKA